MSVSVLAFLALIAVSAAAPAPMTFDAYVKKYNKVYSMEEYPEREKLFLARLEIIREHNEKGLSHSYGINHMTDWKEAEYASLLGFDRFMNHFRRAQPEAHRLASPLRQRESVAVAPSVNWVAANATSPVKNQGGCGSCWAFAGVSSIESDIFVETGHLPILSPQLYVDCVSNTAACGGTGGCAGATPDILFKYAIDNGARLEAEYPYRGDEGYCLAGRTNNVAGISGWVDVLTNDYNALLQAVNKQPVTIGVAANSWGLYSDGVLKFDACDSDINHAVLLVGYGTDPVHGDYWLVQNSWGPDWGESGLIRLERNSGDSQRCKEDSRPADGFACKGQTEPVKTCGTCGILYAPSYPVGGHML